MSTRRVLDALAHPVRDAGFAGDYDPLLELVGDARIVLLGESTHGTHEFYRARVRITQRLVREKGFDAVAVEADWSDAYRVNRFVRWAGHASLREALSGFRRFPQWMWQNTDVIDLVQWLRSENEHRPSDQRVGFVGLDVYGLHESMAAVIEYLRECDPAAARAVRERYACFDAFGEDAHAYGYATSLDLSRGCEEQALSVLRELRENAWKYLQADGVVAEDAQFVAEQNALVVRNAERYYREMYRGRASSWNLRDTHMADTLDALLKHLGRHGREAKLVVWAHNSHVGDARATSMGQRGELNLGQLVRERHGEAARNIGFTTYHGTVAAASEWDGPVRRKRVLPARPHSIEWHLHRAEPNAFFLDLRRLPSEAGFHQPLLERAIGVIYRPATELFSHYFHAVVPEQFDAIVHFDRTRAIEPLERLPGWTSLEPAETYPTGI